MIWNNTGKHIYLHITPPLNSVEFIPQDMCLEVTLIWTVIYVLWPSATVDLKCKRGKTFWNIYFESHPKPDYSEVSPVRLLPAEYVYCGACAARKYARLLGKCVQARGTHSFWLFKQPNSWKLCHWACFHLLVSSIFKVDGSLQRPLENHVKCIIEEAQNVFHRDGAHLDARPWPWIVLFGTILYVPEFTPGFTPCHTLSLNKMLKSPKLRGREGGECVIVQ